MTVMDTVDGFTRAGIVVLSVLTVGSEIFRHATAVAALRRAGAGPWTGVGNWKVWPEMRAYKELLVREGRSLRWWRLWWILHFVTIAGMLAFAVNFIIQR